MRTGLAHATGSVTVIQDADLEYNPRDLPRLMAPFITGEADAVFGSRFMTSSYRRALYYRHAIGNRLLTTLSNLLTDLGLTDMETCYKAVRTHLLKSIPIRSRDFRLEVELTFKLAKRRARVFEVPISYAGRTYEEGKKIGFRDALRALGAMAHWWLIDDMYAPDEYGSEMVGNLLALTKLHRWVAALVRPYVGSRVLELGAGVANLTRQAPARAIATPSATPTRTISPTCTTSARGSRTSRLAGSTPRSRRISGHSTASTTRSSPSTSSRARATIVQALRNIGLALAPGGRAIVAVPYGPHLFSHLDEVVGHRRRYSREDLRAALEAAGFEVEELFDFNRFAAAGLVAQRSRAPCSRVQQAAAEGCQRDHVRLASPGAGAAVARRVADRGSSPNRSARRGRGCAAGRDAASGLRFGRGDRGLRGRMLPARWRRIDHRAHRLNTRPQKTLGYRTPADIFASALR